MEYNSLPRRFWTNRLFNYSHYNQPIGLLANSGQNEFVFRLNYRLRRFLAEGCVNYVNYENRLSLPSANQNQSTKPYSIFEHVTNDYNLLSWQSNIQSSLELAYIVNPATNLKIFTKYNYRKADILNNDLLDNSTHLFYFGIRTDLRNIYYDF